MFLFIYIKMSNFKRVFLEIMFSKPKISQKQLIRFTWNLVDLIYTKKAVFNVADFFRALIFLFTAKNRPIFILKIAIFKLINGRYFVKN